jgi:hypothetical protein
MKNVTELQTKLADVWAKLEIGAIKVDEAQAYSRLAGGMIGAAKAQLSYYAQRKETPNIPFLGGQTDV